MPALIAATTEAATATFRLSSSRKVWLVIHGTLGADDINIQITYDGGTNWVNLYDENGDQVLLNAARPTFPLCGPGYFRANLDDPTGAIGLWMATDNDLS